MKQHYSAGGIVFLCLISFGVGVVTTASMAGKSKLALDNQKEKLAQVYALDEKLTQREWALSRRLRIALQRPAPIAMVHNSVAVAALPHNTPFRMIHSHVPKSPAGSVVTLAMLPTNLITPATNPEPSVIKPLQSLAAIDRKRAEILKSRSETGPLDRDIAAMGADPSDLDCVKLQTDIELQMLMQADLEIKVEMAKVINRKYEP